MVTNCQVFGARAGRFAAEHARGTGARDLPPQALERPYVRLYEASQGQRGMQGRSGHEVLDALQQATGTHLVVVRNEHGLQTLLARIEELREDWLRQVATLDLGAPDASTLRRAIEVENALLTAELMARAALAPREPGQPFTGGLSATGRSELAGERAVSGGGGPAVARAGRLAE